ncbi:hypothetical protein TB2_025914 [Malus domestica]
MTYLPSALHALKRSEEALVMMENAVRADKKNPLPMYHKASILMSLEKFDEALARNMHEKAMLHFSYALDLKPSSTDVVTIKADIEKLHVPDELDDE